MAENLKTRKKCEIDILPDDVLLGVFDFYMVPDTRPSIYYRDKLEIEAWRPLVRVCRRWKNLVLGSPRRLNLQLCCTRGTPRETLNNWPALRLNVLYCLGMALHSRSGADNLIAALGQSNRVCQVALVGLQVWALVEFLAVMQVPFPELTNLVLDCLLNNSRLLAEIPDSFLGGSAPRLQEVTLFGIAFTRFPKAFFSATHLHTLRLSIPRNAYISPEAIVALVSVFPSLRILFFAFQYPDSHPDMESRSLPPPKHSILPALDVFILKGYTEYLEDLVTRIDTPKLNKMEITFLDQTDFGCPLLAQFVNRTPKLRKCYEAHLQYHSSCLSVLFGTLEIQIACTERDRWLPSVAHVCNSFIDPLSTVEELHIEHGYGTRLDWAGTLEDTPLWLQLLLPFTRVTDLYISNGFESSIAEALQELDDDSDDDSITEVLPSLRHIFVEGSEALKAFHENIGEFVSERQYSGRTVVISDDGRRLRRHV